MAQKEKTVDNIIIPVADFTLQNGAVIALQADNGLYLSRINYGDKNPIEAAKSSIDVFSKFKIKLLQG